MLKLECRKVVKCVIKYLVIHIGGAFSIHICIFITSMSVQVEYKKGHEERVSKYTTFADPPEVLLAKTQSQIASNVSFYRWPFTTSCGFVTVTGPFALGDRLLWMTGCYGEMFAMGVWLLGDWLL